MVSDMAPFLRMSPIENTFWYCSTFSKNIFFQKFTFLVFICLIVGLFWPLLQTNIFKEINFNIQILWKNHKSLNNSNFVAFSQLNLSYSGIGNKLESDLLVCVAEIAAFH